MILSAPVASPENLSRYVLSSDSDSELVELLGPRGDDTISHAMELRLRGSNYGTREDAIEAGKRWRDRLTVAFAHYEKGIEIGSDETPEVAEWSGGQPYFLYDLGRGPRDTPKLTVFPTDSEPRWGGLFGEGVVAHGIETFINGHLAWVRQRECRLNPQQQLAYRLFHAAYFEFNFETVYILLFTGVEALIPKRFRTEPYINALERLRASVADMDAVQDSVKESLDRLLEYKENESIRYRGRTWVQELLGTNTFDGKSSEEFFLDAYETRNSVAHGNVNRPTAESLKEQIPELRRYLLALLDMGVFAELMPGLTGFEPNGTIRQPDAS